jgi:hypothetical protein
MRDRRSNSPPLRQAQGRLSRRKREKDGAPPPIFVAKGRASPQVRGVIKDSSLCRTLRCERSRFLHIDSETVPMLFQ